MLGATLAMSCGDDVTAPEGRPDPDELLQFYTDFCAHWRECEQGFGWSDAVACANDQVEYYDKLPTACLKKVVDFHQCSLELTCDKFNSYGTHDYCQNAHDAIRNVECGGMSAP